MKILLTILGVISFVIAVTDIGFAVQDGILNNVYYFSTVKQVATRFLPELSHIVSHFISTELPNFIDQPLTWVGRQTAYIFFGIIGLLLIFSPHLAVKGK